MTKVSIIVPVYNEEHYLRDCVFSIRNQTYQNIEIILVDDGSTNSAKEQCDILKAEDKRIVVLHKHNEGLSAARVDGVKLSTGSWIMFVDNDDVISPYVVEELLSFSNSNTNIDIIAGNRIDLYDVKNVVWKHSSLNDSTIYSGKEIVEQIPTNRQETIITPMWGKLYRKEFLENIDLEKYKKICKTIFFEDVLMTPIIYTMAEKICLVDVVYYAHREVPTSISRSGKLSSFYYEQIESGNILIEYTKEKCLKNYYSYELGLYFRTILRIWCLMDDDCISNQLKNEYRKKICKYYKKYLGEYLRYGKDNLLIKMLFLLFYPSKKMWGLIVNALYYKKSKRLKFIV